MLYHLSCTNILNINKLCSEWYGTCTLCCFISRTCHLSKAFCEVWQYVSYMHVMIYDTCQQKLVWWYLSLNHINESMTLLFGRKHRLDYFGIFHTLWIIRKTAFSFQNITVLPLPPVYIKSKHSHTVSLKNQ